MLTHKVDSEHPTSYSDLLLAAWKLVRRAEARDPLLLKSSTTWGLNITCSQTPGNVFTSQKLKGNHTFTAWSCTVENNEAEEDSGVKPEGKGEADSSAGEDTETSSGVGGADQLLGYIVPFMNTVELYQKKKWHCFRCGSPDYLMRDCSKDLSKTTWKASLNVKEWMTKMGSQASQKPVVTQVASRNEAPWVWGYLRKLPSWTQIHLLVGVDLRM